MRWLDISDTNPGSTSVLLSLDDGDQFGLGEIHLPAGADKATVLHLARASADMLAPIDLRNINMAIDAVSGLTDQDATAGPAVRAAFDVALHDLNGKLRGCPVHVMLGGSYRSEIAISKHFRSGAAVPDADAIGTTSVLMEYRAEPSRQIASFGPTSAIGWLTAAIERLGPTVQVDIDASCSFDNPALARTCIEGLLSGAPRLNIGLLQPLNDDDLVGHAALCAALPIPIILDRSVHSAKAMNQIVRIAAADRVVVNIERVGGLRAAMQIVSIAEAASMGVSSATFCCTAVGAAAALHFAAVLHDTFPARLDNMLSDNGRILDSGTAVAAGVAEVGTAPGLGVQLRDDAMAAFRPAL